MPRILIPGLLLLVLLSGCRHSIVIVGKGDVTSASGNRDCLLEDFEAEAPACVDNQVTGAYEETYYAVPRPGYMFGGWGNYCTGGGVAEHCAFNFSEDAVLDANWEEAAPLVAYFRKEVDGGQHLVSMGNLIFHPISNELPVFTEAAGIEDHTQLAFYSGSGGGSAIAFWEEEQGADYEGVRHSLNQGDVDLLGMNYYPGDYEEQFQGYKRWIVQAQLNNNKFGVFLAVPWLEDPDDYTLKEHRDALNDNHENQAHAAIDDLREDYSTKDIFCIPYGQAALELIKLFEREKLPEISALVGGQSSAIFRNSDGRPGDMLTDLSSLIMLRAIYGIDLEALDFGLEYSVDLPALANKILNQHDHHYDAP
jgi:hypothetical protein